MTAARRITAACKWTCRSNAPMAAGCLGGTGQLITGRRISSCMWRTGRGARGVGGRGRTPPADAASSNVHHGNYRYLVLHGRLELHDCRDIEALCINIVNRSRLTLNHYDREDLIAYLVVDAWKLSLRYQPGRGSTRDFTGWAHHILTRRVIEWQRTKYGRYRPRPATVSLDDPMEHTDHAITGDPTDDRSTDLTRILRPRSSPPPRRARHPDQTAPHPATHRTTQPPG